MRRGIRFENKRDLTTRLREKLPFELTGAQVRASREIFADMCSDRRMHRLLQGDVGSGKTIVALFAALLALENGYQAALMVPTELLAEQHERTIQGLLASLGIALCLIAVALSIGIAGYHLLGRFNWIDSLLEASMILGGMGPVNELPNNAAKIFASAYALFSGLMFIAVMGIVLTPVVHRVLHKFHVDESETD